MALFSDEDQQQAIAEVENVLAKVRDLGSGDDAQGHAVFSEENNHELREDDKQAEQEPKSRHWKRKEQRRAKYLAKRIQGINTNRNPPSQWG